VMAGVVGVGRFSAWGESPKAQVSAASSSLLVDALDAELHRAMGSLGSGADQPKPYFLSYAVADNESVSITAQYGAIVGSNGNRRRVADVQVRLGTAALDNSH